MQNFVLVLGLIIQGSLAEPPVPQGYSTVSIGRPYQDRSPLDGIDLNQLLASAGEKVAPFDTFAASGYVASNFPPPQTGYAAPPVSHAQPAPPGPGGFGLPGYPEDKEFVIKKQISIHVPPPESEFYLPPPRPHHPIAREKHYKIIFIKAPSPPPIIPADYYIPPQPEQKTLVYVLVKKPEPLPHYNIPVPPPTPISKPEVYFIRYKPPGGPELGGPVPALGAPTTLDGGSPGPHSHYGAPAPAYDDLPVSTYGLPVEPAPAKIGYGAPASPPRLYAPSPKPVQSFGPPAPTYGAPAHTYGPPAPYSSPAQTYGPPAQTYSHPAQTYGSPSQTYANPAPTYGPPAHSYNPPSPQHTYSPPSHAYGAPSSLRNTYAASPLSLQAFNLPRPTYASPALKSL